MWIIVFTLSSSWTVGLRASHRLASKCARHPEPAMAASMGIRTSRIDALTSGSAPVSPGFPRRALADRNVSPNLGQAISSTLHGRGVRGVGKPLGHAGRSVHRSASPTSSWSPMPAPCSATIAILVLIILFIQKRPRGLFALKAGRSRHDHRSHFPLARSRRDRLPGHLAAIGSGAGAQSVGAGDIAFHLSSYSVALFGKYLCYALLALAIDLIWGYCGILSLGHGAFFALAATPWACT